MRASGRLAAALFLALSGASPAFAAQDLAAALRACRAEADDARRLACYDHLAGRAEPAADAAAAAPKANMPAVAPGAAPAAAPPAVPAPAAAATPEDKFGRERAMAAEETRRAAEEARSLSELTALVTGIDTRIDGLKTISLDNGQVWRQNAPDSGFRLKVGDRIRIQPGSLNSFILSGPSKRSTRVTRVK